MNRDDHSRLEALEAELRESRRVTRSLQEALLPQHVPVVPGLDVDAAHLLAPRTLAGGDWYDVVARPSGRVALVAGSTVGTGAAAAAVMGRLRTVLDERLGTDAPLADVLAALDRYARREAGARATTVCVVEVDPTTGEGEYCTAGHVPPVHLPLGGDATFLPLTGAVPLATRGDLTTAALRLEPGDLLVLHTADLVERPGDGSAAVRLLAGVTASATADGADPAAPRRTSERVCGSALDLLVRSGEPDDDVTVVVAQRVAVPAPLLLDLTADDAAPGQVRRAVAAWLEELGARPLDGTALQHAVGELVTNVADHAYDGAPGPLHVEVALPETGIVSAVVGDLGRWREPVGAPPDDRGHGLSIAREMVDDLTIESTDDGTRVCVRTPLCRAAQLWEAGDDRPTGRSLGDGTRLRMRWSDDGTRLEVVGHVDAGSADRFLVQLRRGTTGRRRPLTVDLRGVTHLTSSGVRALHDVAGEREALGDVARLRLVVAPESSIGRILDLAGLPHGAAQAG